MDDAEKNDLPVVIEEPKTYELDLKINLKKVDFNARHEKQKEVHAFIRSHEDDYERMEKQYADAISFILINYNFDKNHVQSFINLCFEYDFVKTLINLLTKSIAVLDAELSKKDDSAEFKRNMVPIFITYTMTSIIRSFSNYSPRFCTEFQELDGIVPLFSLINDSILVESCKKAENVKEPSENFPFTRIIRCCIGSLINFGRVNSSFISKYREAKAVESLLLCSNLLDMKSDVQIACYIALALIAEDEEVEKFSELKKVIPGIVNIIRKITVNFKDTTGDYVKIKRTKIHVKEDSPVADEVACCTIGETMWHLVEILNALYHLAVTDSIKMDIYSTNNMSEYLRVLIYNGNIIEVEHALKLLHQLCFNMDILKQVHEDTQLYAKILDLNQSENIDILKSSSGIVWLVNKKLIKTADTIVDEKLNDTKESDAKYKERNVPKTKKKAKNEAQGKGDSNQESKEVDSKHIMISYNRECRELCLKIKEELEKLNYKVWIDVESIHGSSLESMANAIENSMCVLICMTEKYKQSSNCRAEAEYAFSINKPIIPLIMQSNYQPSGWLGNF